MKVRSEFIKVRVNRDEHRDVQKRADAMGLTLSEYVRATVTAVHERLDVVTALEALRVQCAAHTQPPTPHVDPVAQDSLVLEAVLLLRELAAVRDAQILSRVRAQLTQRGLATAPTGKAS